MNLLNRIAHEVLGINRNIVECKFRKTGSYQKQLSELIETLWNVNAIISTGRSSPVDELIETLWNVNEICRIGLSGTYCGINRNIVECKYHTV